MDCKKKKEKSPKNKSTLQKEIQQEKEMCDDIWFPFLKTRYEYRLISP
jgi:hypothetical protein